MIRKIKLNELEVVMKIWLEANISAHDFISESYWTEKYELVKSLLPDAAIYVFEENNVILGFIGLYENYIAGIFIDINSQSKGIGKALLDFVKEKHEKLSLQVYKKNHRAVNFYTRESFIVSKEQIDDNTGEAELVMEWAK